MARISVRYLTVRPPAGGGLPRYFWMPSPSLRKEGWRAERVPANWAEFTDPVALEAAAIARANECNAFLDAARSQHAAPIVRAMAPPSRTIGALVTEYLASEAFTDLAPSTQRSYRQCLLKIETWAADAPVAAIDELRIKRLKRGLAATPAFSNAVVRVLRLLLEFARRDLHWITRNPAARPDLAGTDPSGVIWPRAAVDLFVSTADAMGYHSMGTAVLLNEWMGQRQGDIIRMPRSVIRDGNLVLRQSKTRVGVSLPISMIDRLQTRLDAELARHATREAAALQAGVKAPLPVAIIVSEETGRAYRADNFRHVFARVRKEMAKTKPHFPVEHLMPGRDMTDPLAFTVQTADLTFMQLRHTAVTRLAEAGCDTTLISAITGHAQTTVQQLMDRYMVRTAAMARTAFQRRLDAEKGADPKKVSDGN